MEFTPFVQVLLYFGLFIFLGIPWVLAFFSKKANEEQKLVWLLSSFCLSWVGYYSYYLLEIKPKHKVV